MKRFSLKISIFLILLVLFYSGIYWGYYKFSLPRGSNICYIWGDSQLCQGLDLSFLDKNSKYHYYSSAEQGAGIYDFLVFTELVPENSHVIISIGRGVLIRGNGADRNESAINFKALLKLHKNNYTLKEIYGIIRKNQQPRSFFYEYKYPLFPNEDSLKKIEPITAFDKMYLQKPNRFDDKGNLYIEGIKTLIKKKCNIIAIDFPFHPLVIEIEKKSAYRESFNSFDKEIAECFERKEIIQLRSKENIFRDTNLLSLRKARSIGKGLVEINSDNNIFRDMTHFNERGAALFTKRLLDYLNFKDKSLLILVKQSDI